MNQAGSTFLANIASDSDGHMRTGTLGTSCLCNVDAGGVTGGITVKKMDRVQFYLNAGDNKRLDKLARKLNVSKASLIREGVKKILNEKLPLEDDPAYKLIGLIDKLDDNNVAEKHDYYLYGEGRPDHE